MPMYYKKAGRSKQQTNLQTPLLPDSADWLSGGHLTQGQPLYTLMTDDASPLNTTIDDDRL